MSTDRTTALRYLFGLIKDEGESSFDEENIKSIEQMRVSLGAKMNADASTTPCLMVRHQVILFY